MSRGLGKIEKSIIKRLEYSDNCAITEIIKEVWGRETTNAQRQSIWRAVRALEKHNIIKSQKSRMWSDRPKKQHGGHSSCKVICLVQHENVDFAKFALKSTLNAEVIA